MSERERMERKIGQRRSEYLAWEWRGDAKGNKRNMEG